MSVGADKKYVPVNILFEILAVACFNLLDLSVENEAITRMQERRREACDLK